VVLKKSGLEQGRVLILSKISPSYLKEYYDGRIEKSEHCRRKLSEGSFKTHYDRKKPSGQDRASATRGEKRDGSTRRNGGRLGWFKRPQRPCQFIGSRWGGIRRPGAVAAAKRTPEATYGALDPGVVKMRSSRRFLPSFGGPRGRASAIKSKLSPGNRVVPGIS